MEINIKINDNNQELKGNKSNKSMPKFNSEEDLEVIDAGTAPADLIEELSIEEPELSSSSDEETDGGSYE